LNTTQLCGLVTATVDGFINVFNCPFLHERTFLESGSIPPHFHSQLQHPVGLAHTLCLIYYADFKHTWISIHARAAGQSRPYLENFSDFEHGLGKNLSGAEKLVTSLV
jgi:hypothetical protein